MARKTLSLLICIALATCCLTLGGCDFSYHAPQSSTETTAITGDATTMLDISDPAEKEAVELAMAKVQALGRTPRVIATSPATVEICDKLGMELVGVCSSTLHETPERYKDLPVVGTAMSPDMEKVGSLSPDWILSPSSLESDLKPKYEAIGVDYAFLNLESVQGMYKSIEELGEIFGYEDEAAELTSDFTNFYTKYQTENASKTRPKVLILMGLPGSYVIATKKSYVGNLVELAGGENVYDDESEDFIDVNTEDMKSKEPDIILRAVHALPDQVTKMFDKDFKENDIWKHFSAVQNGLVFDLPYDSFGMSATFDYKTALEDLQTILYDHKAVDTSANETEGTSADSESSESGNSGEGTTETDNGSTQNATGTTIQVRFALGASPFALEPKRFFAA